MERDANLWDSCTRYNGALRPPINVTKRELDECVK